MRLDKTKFEGPGPVLAGANIHYEVAERTHGIACGGIGLIHDMVQRLGLAEAINRSVPVFKRYLPYSESDHVLNIAYNLLAGGTCLDHLELRRNDEAYLDALGVRRIPDPTTAGDFCRRFEPHTIQELMETINTDPTACVAGTIRFFPRSGNPSRETTGPMCVAAYCFRALTARVG